MAKPDTRLKSVQGYLNKVNSSTGLTAQQIFNKQKGYVGLTTQEALNRSKGYPHGTTEQQALFRTIKGLVTPNLTDPCTQYTVQQLLAIADANGLTLSQLI